MGSGLRLLPFELHPDQALVADYTRLFGPTGGRICHVLEYISATSAASSHTARVVMAVMGSKLPQPVVGHVVQPLPSRDVEIVGASDVNRRLIPL